ncbi:ABC transporter substrate-binding protein [Salinirubellus salinus]|uniref:ABC transporter substrate-binding protein n=1 Tax=Salinirubellus salinus TaxID=1364945 RepID=A0A9E7U9R3_9EURY|nr:ABC transporter substrate-binding protein [Salinirubellus salinus]UWM53282.1 ABC transporter substrate-binding protein [Salinirubellus salinus]
MHRKSDAGEENDDSRVSRRTFVAAAGTATATALAGCSSGGDGTPTPTSGGGGGGGDDSTPTPDPAAAQQGGTLVAGMQSGLDGRDPHLVQAASTLRVLENIYGKLVEIDQDLKPVGQLATDWTVSDDDLTWTFQLREGVMFHPPVSRELTAADVVYSFERLLDEETGSPWRSNFTPIANVSADGDYTVVFEFDEPYAPFLFKLSSGGYILPEGADDASDYDISDQPVGTGPFVFDENVAQARTNVTAFEDYYETDGDDNALPYLDEVEFQVIPEGQARLTNLQSGSIDWAVTVPPSQASQLEGNSSVTLSNIPGTFYDYLGHNTTQEPLDDVRLRQAISWAIDRESIVQGARFGYATPTQDPIPPSSVWKDLVSVEEPYSQDLEQAQSLVDESDYDGEELTIQVGQQYPAQVNIAEIIQQQLGEVGITATVQPTDFGTMISNLNEGAYDLTIVGWSGFVDPDDMMYLQFHSGETFNQSNYSNEEVDELLEQGRQAAGDREERAQYYDDAIDIISREVPYTFLEFNDELAAWGTSVKNFTHISTGTPRFKNVWLEQ